ncbi:MAG: hypothetical protein A2289_13705 [Deltaproteobacteria bacterium RIFOXYA12_FULL_58_15]|nr:MAG: hypothetical protein A2289_13705 [Deltaproteobacteria bacterium RIFOXYA12_FULL_58_15]OGR09667.1 MAG: hypothetical protein A2341_14830 [Deltaproteobacteria bacterium RIFOXYB12_FULL_58_9]
MAFRLLTDLRFVAAGILAAAMACLARSGLDDSDLNPTEHHELPTSFSITAPVAFGSDTSPYAAWTLLPGAVRYDLVVATDQVCAIPVQHVPSVMGTAQQLATIAYGTYHVCIEAFDVDEKATPASNNGYAFVLTGGIVLGQPDEFSNSDNSANPSASTLARPYQALIVGSRFFVADSFNHRVLIWNSIPTTNQEPADLVLGQPHMTSNAINAGGAVSARTFNRPAWLQTDGTRLLVSDQGNHRVLIWNSLPTTNNQAADVVIGQPDMTSNMANNGGISGASFVGATNSVVVDGKLFVADLNNHRVLMWNSIPTTNFVAADLVLGQSDMTSGLENAGGAVSAQTMSWPTGVDSDGVRLYVADYRNSRVLIWNSIPTVDQQAADLVIGQPDFAANTANNGGIGAQSLRNPQTAHSDGTRLYVGDTLNNRILIWNSIPNTHNAAADEVMGQPDFVTATANTGGVSLHSMSWPFSLFTDGLRFYYADTYNNRIVIIPKD